MLNASLIYVQLAFLATVRVQAMAIGAGIGLAAVGVYRAAARPVDRSGGRTSEPQSLMRQPYAVLRSRIKKSAGYRANRNILQQMEYTSPITHRQDKIYHHT